MRIGIDFGGVLTETASPPSEGFLKIPPRHGSREEIAKIIEVGDTPVLISKANSAEKQAKARLWLAHWGFDELFRSNAEFCTEQAGKIEIARRLGVTAMVDDTSEQLELLKGVVDHLILFDAITAPQDMVAVRDWEAAGQVLGVIRSQNVITTTE